MALLFVIWIGIGWALYREANRFASQNGQCPWGMPPVFWGIVGLMLGLIGAVFMLIAEKTTTKRPANNVVWSQGPYADPRFAPPQQQWAPPAPVPGPTGQWGPPPAPASPPPQQWAPPAPPGAPAPAAPPAPPAPNVGGSEFLPKR
jgi:hypothetical protein